MKIQFSLPCCGSGIVLVRTVCPVELVPVACPACKTRYEVIRQTKRSDGDSVEDVIRIRSFVVVPSEAENLALTA